MTLPSFDGEAPPPYAPDTKPRAKNVILFGETGAGKSAVINLIAGTEVAPTSRDARACTLQSTKHSLTLPGESPGTVMAVDIFDTIGLEEPDQNLPGLTALLGAVDAAHALITTLHAAGGVDLLLFCIRAGRITVAMQRHYRLFFEVMCQEHVPLAIVVTHLENEVVMEDWWFRNEVTFSSYGIRSVAHACVTAVPASLVVFATKRVASRTALVRMLRETLSSPRPAYIQKDVKNWFLSVLEMLVAFLTGGRVSLEENALARKLESRCWFPHEEAQRFAKMLLGKRS